MAERRLIRLYVSGVTPRSARAIQSIKAICEERLPGRYELEVIDVYQQGHRAGRDGVLATPTLIQRTERSVRRLVGNLSDRKRVLAALGLASR